MNQAAASSFNYGWDTLVSVDVAAPETQVQDVALDIVGLGEKHLRF
jgi:hypothetical protein